MNIYTKETVKLEALKFKTRNEFRVNSNLFYQAAHRKGWLDEICNHMAVVVRYTKSDCLKLAAKFDSRIKFKTANPSAYKTCREKLWLEDCCKHMKNYGGTSNKEQELFDIIKSKYPSATKKYFSRHTRGCIAKRFQIDIFIPEINKGIEFNGTYWHSLAGLKTSKPNWSLEMLKNYHTIKRIFIESFGVGYIDIWEIDWDKDKQKCIDICFNFLKG